MSAPLQRLFHPGRWRLADFALNRNSTDALPVWANIVWDRIARAALPPPHAADSAGCSAAAAGNGLVAMANGRTIDPDLGIVRFTCTVLVWIGCSNCPLA